MVPEMQWLEVRHGGNCSRGLGFGDQGDYDSERCGLESVGRDTIYILFA